MTTFKKNLHWTAVIGVAFSFWLLIWLILIVASLFDLKELNSTTDTFSLKLFMVVVGVFALWSVYRVRKRIDLLRNGELCTAQIVREKREEYDMNSGATNKVTDCSYCYQVGGMSYSHMILWTVGLKGKKSINIVYNTHNPNYSAISSRLRARFDPNAKEWRSSMWHVIPRLTLMVIIVVGIVTLLFSDTSPFS